MTQGRKYVAVKTLHGYVQTGAIRQNAIVPAGCEFILLGENGQTEYKVQSSGMIIYGVSIPRGWAVELPISDMDFYQTKANIVDDIRELLAMAETRAQELIDWEKKHAYQAELAGLKGIVQGIQAAADQVAKEKDDLEALGFGA